MLFTPDFSGRRVTIMGLGRHGGGVAAARFIAERGAAVTVTDRLPSESLRDSLANLAGAPIASWSLGGHREEDFTSADELLVNPAVRPGDPWVRLAIESGARITSEIEVFLRHCRGRVVGISGSNGKSTTAAMTAAILRADGRRVWLGGNIGWSLLPRLHEIETEDWVVLELSSFQLWWLSEGAARTQIAAVTNLTPNHLDWHGSLEHYAAAKRRLLIEQPVGGRVAIHPSEETLAGWRSPAQERLLVCPADGDLPTLRVPGRHNRQNASLAAAIALGAGCAWPAVKAGLSEFGGLPHRLERVALRDGRTYYNDSMATTPESTMAALATFERRIWLLTGGYDKGLEYGPLLHRAARQARGVALFGATRLKWREAFDAMPDAPPRCCVESLAEALAWCEARADDGDAIVLSPACASYDQFRDYRHRGETFAALARGAST